MAKVIVGTIVIALMCCGAAVADTGGVFGVGAGTVGLETPTGLPAGTIATNTPTATPTDTGTPSETPTRTPIPPSPTFSRVLDPDSGGCAVVESTPGRTGWWLAVLPLVIGWRRRTRRGTHLRTDE